ncbi:penicillin-binding protein 1A [uncultured Massilia sp.]|uniref:penicillin-binding protein 1A n=1 Tax=uncultured Massilia sp. TaxID=169973 RepID=UPI0027D96BD5|nr:transglycosylase domain-containing protein [uncultured Massilia sp.]
MDDQDEQGGGGRQGGQDGEQDGKRAWDGRERRLIDRATGRALENYERTRAHLMRKPPLQRWLWIAGGAFVLLLVLFAGYVALLFPLTPAIADVRQARVASPTVVLSADGRELASFERGVQERVRLSEVSPHVVTALIATEDHRFYDHHGVDFTRIAGAVVANLKGDAQGGSTITQQLARNMFHDEIGRARNLNRKLKELITAIKIENTYSKTEILEAYLNTVPFLYNTFGIEAAARTYFSKSAARLDETEAATLVGMLKGTAYYNPVTNPERSLARRNVVLGQMLKAGAFDEKRYAQLVRRPLRVRFQRQAERTGKDDHFTTYVRKWLVDWAEKHDADLQQDGLVVQTTLDYDLQQDALRAVARQADALQAVADVDWAHSWQVNSTSTATYAGMREGVTPFAYYWQSHAALLDTFVRESPDYRKAVDGGEDPAAALRRLQNDREFMRQLKTAKSRLEAGFVAMDPNTGEVKAWVGSRDFAREQYDHVAQAARQPGSTFKPIVYAAALEQGIPPDQPYLDAVTEIRFDDGTVWRPTDMSGTTGRRLSMRDGLALSKNTITAQVTRDVGVAPIVKLAQNMGIRQSKLQQVPSIALGTSPVTLLEMVSAYSTIAAGGAYRHPVFVRRISDRDGRVLADFGSQQPQRALSEASAGTLLDMMRGVIDRGTGTAIRNRFGIWADVAGKTGTTQNNADGWFIMMHPNLVAGAWVGFNDNRVTMRSNYWGQGGHSAILLVGDFFKTVLDSGRISADTVFPGGRKPEPPRRAEPVEEPMEEGGGFDQEGGPPADLPQPPDAEPPAPPQEPQPVDVGTRFPNDA